MIGLDTKIRILLGFQGQTTFLEHKRFQNSFLGHFFRISVSRPMRTQRSQKVSTLPVQLRPFPIYPGLQKQWYDPFVLLQKAFALQSWEFVLHSSISKKGDRKKHKIRQIVKKKKKEVRRNLFSVSRFPPTMHTASANIIHFSRSSYL